MFVRQVIVCTKETSVGARKNAYTLLVEIGKAFVRFCGGNSKGEERVCNYCRSDQESDLTFLAQPGK